MKNLQFDIVLREFEGVPMRVYYGKENNRHTTYKEITDKKFNKLVDKGLLIDEFFNILKGYLKGERLC